MSDDLLKEPLPEPWTFGVTKDGRVFFINDEKNTTTWLHPDTGQPAMTGFCRPLDLPNGWEQGFSQDGDVYYIDHTTQQTTFDDPRVGREEEPNDSTASKKKKRRPSFTETLTRPLFRRSSVREKRPSSARRSNSFTGHKGIKMTAVRRDPNATATRSGWLYKQDSSGVGGMKIWRKRWFVLSDFCLFYYKDTKEDEILGSIVLPSYAVNTVNPDDKITRKYAFKIEHAGMRTYYICAESYNDMAEWVTDLTRLCTFHANQSGSRKSLNSKENTKPTEEEQAFGFSEPRSQTKSSESGSASSTPLSPKKDVVNGNRSNAKTSTSASALSFRGVSKHQNGSSRPPRSSSASNRTPTSSYSSSSVQQKRQNSAPPTQRQPGAKQSYFPYNHHQPQENNYSDVSTPEDRRRRHENNNVGRTNSMAKLGSWVQSQKMKQQYSTMNTNRNVHYHTGPRPGQQRAPTSGKRYKPGTYSDYMDSAEVASSIMSVPPMYRNKVVSLPRPRSSQDVDDGRGRRKKLNNSKSVGYVAPDYHKTPFQTKSEYSLSPKQYSVSSKSPLSADSTRKGYDDVFSPIGNNVQDQRRFKYDSASTRRTPSFHAAISPTAPKSSTYEVKQVDVQGKQGQLRAFAISSKTSNTTHSASSQQPAVNKENQSSSDDQIESKLKRLNELDDALQKLSTEIQKLQRDKRLLEQSLNRAKSSQAIGIGSEFELEQRLTKVKSKLTKSSQNLKEMSKENEEFEKEIKKMKSKLLDQLNKKMEPKSNQRQLEWQLGRIQLIMEGVNKNKSGLADRLHSVDGESFESDLSPPNSARSGPIKRISSTMPRSPRDVKRHSHDRHSSGSSPYARAPSSSSSASQESKFFTLPGRGVSRATSVDSLTAASITRFTRPSSARSTNHLHRTKSAAERLLSGSYGNLGAAQDPDEVKKIQREINLSRLRTLSGGDTSRRPALSRTYIPTASAHMQVGIDVQMAIKNHRMPKVLQRAKREMQRAEAERKPVKRDYEVGFDIDRFEEDAADEHDEHVSIHDDLSPGVTELDVEPEDIQVDLNLTHQLIAPEKVDIPDRLLDYEDVELTPAQERMKRKKIRAIESMLSRSGQTAPQPTVHLAAALAAEAGTVARAVAYQAQQNKEIHPSLV